LSNVPLSALDDLADDVARLRKEGKSIREIAAALRHSKKAVEKALSRAKARGLLPLGGDRV
jgi:DNA-binding CsgD family transcriptional regulator